MREQILKALEKIESITLQDQCLREGGHDCLLCEAGDNDCTYPQIKFQTELIKELIDLV